MLNNRGPRINPWGTPDVIFSHVLTVWGSNFCSLFSIKKIILNHFKRKSISEVRKPVEVAVHKHVFLQLKDHDKYSQKPLINQQEMHQNLYYYQLLFSVYLSLKEDNGAHQIPSKTTLKFWKYIIKMIWKLLAHELFKYFGDNRQNTYWSIIIPKVSRTLFEIRCYIG